MNDTEILADYIFRIMMAFLTPCALEPNISHLTFSVWRQDRLYCFLVYLRQVYLSEMREETTMGKVPDLIW